MKSLTCLQPMKKKPQICSGKTSIFIADEASKTLKPKDHILPPVKSFSVTYIFKLCWQASVTFQRTWKTEYSKFPQFPGETWLVLSPMKWNPHFFFQRDFSPGAHMLSATAESTAAVVFCSRPWRAGLGLRVMLTAQQGWICRNLRAPGLHFTAGELTPQRAPLANFSLLLQLNKTQ